LLCQLQADFINIPVKRSQQLQTTGLGAGFLAGLGVGFWQTKEEVVQRAHTLGEFIPQKDRTKEHMQWRRAVERSLNWVD